MMIPSSPYNGQPPYSPVSSVGTVAYSPGGPSVTSAHQPRQRLRPWLIDQINSDKCPGLEWVDRQEMTFKIPWKHFGRPGVDEHNDAMLFRNWALHTKKYQEGQPTDISTWKTRFRCALHKLPDIEEMHSLNQTEGDEPYRVYKFKKKEVDHGAVAGSPLSLPSNANPIALSPVTSYSLTVEDITEQIREDYNRAQTSVPPNNRQISDEVDPAALVSEDLDLPNMEEIEDMEFVQDMMHGDLQMDRYNSAGTNQSAALSSTPASSTPMQNSATSVLIKLFYADQEVGVKVVDNPRGLRIAFNPPPPLPDDVVKEDTSEVVTHIFGPFQAEQIYFPPTNDVSTMAILKCINRGLVLQVRNGEILATRLCRAKVFYSDQFFPTNEVHELLREHTTVVFSYANVFLPRLRSYMLGQGPMPTCERYFSFAQKWSQNAPLRNNFIYVSVVHQWARVQIIEIQRQRPEILVSDPNMLDIIAKQIEDLSVNGVAS